MLWGSLIDSQEDVCIMKMILQKSGRFNFNSGDWEILIMLFKIQEISHQMRRPMQITLTFIAITAVKSTR